MENRTTYTRFNENITTPQTSDPQTLRPADQGFCSLAPARLSGGDFLYGYI